MKKVNFNHDEKDFHQAIGSSREKYAEDMSQLLGEILKYSIKNENLDSRSEIAELMSEHLSIESILSLAVDGFEKEMADFIEFKTQSTEEK